MLMPNQRRRDSVPTIIGPEADADRQADEEHREEQEKAASPPPSEAVKNWAVPTTMPPPANAPKMPSTRPRTSGVLPTYFQPSTNCREHALLGVLLLALARAPR